jgi:hypothetical protein
VKRLKSFDDLKDGLFFEAVLQNYVGEFTFVFEALKGIKTEITNNADRSHNLQKILNALKTINLQHHLNDPSDFL